MNHGIRTVLYPVSNMEASTTLFRKFLGIDPYTEQPYYTGFKVNGQDIGLIPGSPEGTAVAYYHVDDLREKLRLLCDQGAQLVQEARNVGGGRLVATVKDTDGNIIGLIEG